jgi:hypothetical protein
MERIHFGEQKKEMQREISFSYTGRGPCEIQSGEIHREINREIYIWCSRDGTHRLK